MFLVKTLQTLTPQKIHPSIREDKVSMKRLGFFTVLLFLLLTAATFANGGGDMMLKDVIKAVEGPFRAGAAPDRAIRDFQADFVQQAYLGALERVEEGHGRVAVRFDRDGQRLKPLFRWEYAAPTVQEIVSDGRTVWVYLPENKQVLESPLPADDQQERDDPLAFLTGLGELSRKFTIEWADPARSEQGDFRLLLRPRHPSALVEKLELNVLPAAVHAAVDGSSSRPVYPLRSATVYGSSDSRTTILFQNVRLNQGLSEDSFRFEVPPGVEVLKPEEGGLGF
jgi:outer membrane lipoprotein carrier protein